jgi:predicted glycoside hydrolase/deacetylase ChbG (UPF0249 family)
VEHLGRAGDGGWAPSAAAALVVRDAVRDQLERLAETYGDPTHVDGHHHVHLEAGVLEAIPARFPVRPPLSTPDGLGSVRRSPREAVPGRRSPRWAFAVQHVHPALGGTGAAIVALAGRDAVEVMTHPSHEGELAALLGDAWRELLKGLRMGSYASLP